MIQLSPWLNNSIFHSLVNRNMYCSLIFISWSCLINVEGDIAWLCLIQFWVCWKWDLNKTELVEVLENLFPGSLLHLYLFFPSLLPPSLLPPSLLPSVCLQPFHVCLIFLSQKDKWQGHFYKKTENTLKVEKSRDPVQSSAMISASEC